MARSARQVAAARRNIVKAQRASAASRRGKKRSKATGHHYGKGKTGRRQSRTNTYGKKRHGLSIAQQTRRKQRSNRRKRVASGALTAVATGVAVYGNLSPSQKGKVKDYGRTAKTKVQYHTGVGRQIRKAKRRG